MKIFICALWLGMAALTVSAAESSSEKEIIQQWVKKFGTPAPVSASLPFLKSARSAAEFFVHEGLPHQMWDKKLLETEKQRADVTYVNEFPFYIPASRVPKGGALQQLISSAETLAEFRGEKLCGGFHSDYCVSWADGETKFYALICFGCHEVILFSEKTKLRYDLETLAYEQLKNELAPYALKRPRR